MPTDDTWSAAFGGASVDAVVRSELDPFEEGSAVRCPTASLVATAST